MRRTIVFAKRNIIEISRDALSYIFCVAFPIVMLIIMTLVNESIPSESGMTVFRIDNLTGGVVIFGQTFVMLFTALSVSRDRAGSFLTRMFATPMKSSNFTNGYIFPMVAVAGIQAVITFIPAYIISAIVSYDLHFLGLCAALIAVFPSAVMFTAIGLIFGTLFNQNAAPGLCSIIISLGSFLGAIWFDAEATGGILYKICRCLPFIYCTKAARSAIKLDFGAEEFLIPEMIVILTAAVFTVLASVIFKTRMKADLS